MGFYKVPSNYTAHNCTTPPPYQDFNAEMHALFPGWVLLFGVERNSKMGILSLSWVLCHRIFTMALWGHLWELENGFPASSQLFCTPGWVSLWWGSPSYLWRTSAQSVTTWLVACSISAHAHRILGRIEFCDAGGESVRPTDPVPFSLSLATFSVILLLLLKVERLSSSVSLRLEEGFLTMRRA